jgi:tetratricopeptide (TPR) repeat protein
MPFGKKMDSSGKLIDFDEVYQNLIAPAIESADLEVVRADEEMTGGIIHKPMFERLVLCEYAVADLTTANANVFYELGVRHAVKPYSTVLIFNEESSQLPFDVAPLRALPYQWGPDQQSTGLREIRQLLTTRLNEARQAKIDSPVYQLLDDYPDIDHTKTDIFRDRVVYSTQKKKDLAKARKQGLEAIKKIEATLGDVRNVEAGVVIDLFLSYRAVKGWEEMIQLVDRMDTPLAATVMVQEQLGLALNRANRGGDAEKVLLEVIKARGPSSETYGLLGRIFKDRWEIAVRNGSKIEARGLLEKAIDAYRKGFETDWRDAYPGINAVTLMTIMEPPDPERHKLNTVVEYAVTRKVEAGQPDYWDYATLLELAVLDCDQEKAEEHLARALANFREKWEPETTARNLRLIRNAYQNREEPFDWVEDIEKELLAKIGK